MLIPEPNPTFTSRIHQYLHGTSGFGYARSISSAKEWLTYLQIIAMRQKQTKFSFLNSLKNVVELFLGRKEVSWFLTSLLKTSVSEKWIREMEFLWWHFKILFSCWKCNFNISLFRVITMFFKLKLIQIALQYHVLLRHFNAFKAKVKTFMYFKDMGF